MYAGRNLGFLYLFGSRFLPCRLSRLISFDILECILESTLNSYIYAKLNGLVLKQTHTPTCSAIYWVVNLLQVRMQT